MIPLGLCVFNVKQSNIDNVIASIKKSLGHIITFRGKKRTKY